MLLRIEIITNKELSLQWICLMIELKYQIREDCFHW